jgi:hypothetical protein
MIEYINLDQRARVSGVSPKGGMRGFEILSLDITFK